MKKRKGKIRKTRRGEREVKKKEMVMRKRLKRVNTMV